MAEPPHNAPTGVAEWEKCWNQAPVYKDVCQQVPIRNGDTTEASRNAAAVALVIAEVDAEFSTLRGTANQAEEMVRIALREARRSARAARRGEAAQSAGGAHKEVTAEEGRGTGAAHPLQGNRNPIGNGIQAQGDAL